jgi:predicted nuclease with TOPRIM domain
MRNKDMNKKQTRISLFIIFLLTLALGISTIPVKAEPTATIHPSEGTVYTDIFLQVRGLEVFVEGDNWPGFRDMELYLYWDNEPLILGLSDPGSYDSNMHYFDVHLSPPNKHPLSDLGNHTIYIEIYKDWVTYLCNFTLTFEIIEYFPCDEWLALNATYTSLLANYSDLLNDYNQLLADHNTLQANYNNLQSTYNSLLADYNNLLSSYNTLTADYDSLSSNYNELESSYENLSSTYSDFLAVYSQLQSNYDSLQGNYDSLSGALNNLQTSHSSLLSNYTNLQADYDSTCSDYHSLEVDYNSLESSYSSLETDYNSLNSDYTDLNSKHDTLMSDLGFTKNLSYVFIVTTLIFIASTVYLAMKRPKAKPKAKTT